MSIVLDGEALAVWTKHYESVPELVTTKLTLGQRAYEHALSDASGLRIMNQINTIVTAQQQMEMRAANQFNKIQDVASSIVPAINKMTTDAATGLLQSSMAGMDRLVGASTERILGQVLAKAEVRTVQAKLTSKGNVFEQDVAQRLASSSAIASATLIRERDAFGGQGGDIIVTDLSDNVCIIETKNKENIGIPDLTKFVKDADTWSGKPALFAFLVKGGIKTSRKLQDKPLFERSPDGKALLWFRGDEDLFIEQLPTIMGLYGMTMKNETSNNKNQDLLLQQLLSRASESFQIEIKAIKNEISDQEALQVATVKRLKNLKKREAALLEISGAVQSHVQNEEPASKKVRVGQ